MGFIDGEIDGVTVKALGRFDDDRGWLLDFFRSDELAPELFPAMGYISMTRPGVARGPHEHIDQFDYFCFTGPSTFKVYLWDNRPESPTHNTRQIIEGGADSPLLVIIPPKVVHAYRNIGETDGMVINCPNRLYRSEGKSEEVDEVRYEDISNSIYIMD